MRTKPDKERPHARLVSARLNAYGILLALLAVLALADLTHPAGTQLARLAGKAPPGQTWWVAGFALAGAFLMLGLCIADRLAETIGLVILTLAVGAQTVTALALLGWTSYSNTRVAVFLLVALCAAARISTLWSKHGITITIPPRGEKLRRR